MKTFSQRFAEVYNDEVIEGTIYRIDLDRVDIVPLGSTGMMRSLPLTGDRDKVQVGDRVRVVRVGGERVAFVGDVALGFDYEEEVTVDTGGITPTGLEEKLTDRQGAPDIYVQKNEAGQVGINRAPDPQFDLDVAGSIRTGGYFVGPHALQLAGAKLIAHFDGPENSSGGDPNGHMGQVGTLAGTYDFRSGKFNKALHLSPGATLSYGSATAIDITQPGTLSFWRRKEVGDTDTASAVWLSAGTVAPNYFALKNSADTLSVLFVINATTLTMTLPADNEFHHYVLTWDGITASLYIDGVRHPEYLDEVTTQSGAYTSPSVNPSSLLVASEIHTLDDLASLDHAMSGSEVLAVYQSNAPVFAETSTWGFRSASNVAWGDAEGLWTVSSAGNPAFGVSGIDGKSWGGQTLNSGDVMIGDYNNGKGVLWDQSSGELNLRGALTMGGNQGFVTDALLYCAFDGPAPYETNYGGSALGHLGQTPTPSSQPAFRPGKFGKAIQFAEATTNLLAYPGFETSSTGGWTAVGSSLPSAYASEYDHILYGTRAARHRYDADALTKGIQQAWTAPVTADYTFSGWINIYSCSQGILSIDLNGGTRLQFSANTDGWYHFSVTKNCTAGTNYARIFTDSATKFVSYIYLDGLQVEQKSYPTPYCDGSMPGTVWNGTANASTSTRSTCNMTFPRPTNILNKLTAMAWVKPGPGAFSRYVFHGNSTVAASRVYMILVSDGRLSISWNGTVVTGSISYPVLADTWTHVAMTMDGTTVRLYVNGVLAGSGAATGTLATDNTLFYLGAHYNGGANFNGLVDEFALMDRALTGEEIRAIATSDAPLNIKRGPFDLYLGGGVSGGWLIGNGDGLAGYDSDGNKQAWFGSDGKFYAGGNAVRIDEKGLTLFPEYDYGSSSYLKFNNEGVDQGVMSQFSTGAFSSLYLDSNGFPGRAVCTLSLSAKNYTDDTTHTSANINLTRYATSGIIAFNGGDVDLNDCKLVRNTDVINVKATGYIYVPTNQTAVVGWSAVTKSTVGSTVIPDVGAVFTNVPNNAKAMLVRVKVQDSAAWGSGLYFFSMSSDSFVTPCWGGGGNGINYQTAIVNITNNTVNWRAQTSGTNTMTVTLLCMGYFI